jgi:O-methyltransferase
MNRHQHEHSKRLVALLPHIAECGMQSFDRLITLAQCAFNVDPLQGDICEFGCNSGRTAHWLHELLPEKHLWLYDTFAGHPADGEGYKQGDMSAARDGCENIPNTTIVSGNILDLSQASTDVPQTILLAHVDLDGYENTLHTLNLVWPRLHPFGCVIIDDVLDPTYPGVKRALDEFIEFKPFVKYKIEPGCAGLPRVSVVLRNP